MSDNYVVVYSADEPCPWEQDENEHFFWLKEVSAGRCVWVDRNHEPEDMSLGRDLSDFVYELNMQSNQIAKMKSLLYRWAPMFCDHLGCSISDGGKCDCGVDPEERALLDAALK